MGELYGEEDSLTLEWKDGLMAISVRQAVQVSCTYNGKRTNSCTLCKLRDMDFYNICVKRLL